MSGPIEYADLSDDFVESVRDINGGTTDISKADLVAILNLAIAAKLVSPPILCARHPSGKLAVFDTDNPFPILFGIGTEDERKEVHPDMIFEHYRGQTE